MKTNRLTVKQRRVRVVIKWFLYILLIAIAYVFSTVKFSSLAKPIMLIPIAICIASNHSEMLSSIIGLVIGFMIDSAAGKLFGFNGFIMMICCMFVSLLFLYLLRQSMINQIWLTAVVTIIQSLLDFLFFYGIWEFENVGSIFINWYLPSIIFTIIITIPIILITRFIERKFGNPEEHYIEENDENIVRE